MGAGANTVTAAIPPAGDMPGTQQDYDYSRSGAFFSCSAGLVPEHQWLDISLPEPIKIWQAKQKK